MRPFTTEIMLLQNIDQLLEFCEQMTQARPGLSLKQAVMVLEVTRQKAVTQKKLAELTGLSKSAVSKNTTLLVALKFLQIEPRGKVIATSKTIQMFEEIWGEQQPQASPGKSTAAQSISAAQR